MNLVRRIGGLLGRVDASDPGLVIGNEKCGIVRVQACMYSMHLVLVR